MANMILAFPNRGDEATLSGGSWQSALPLVNFQDRLLSKKARSVDLALASTKFDCALTKSRPVRLLALVAHNLSIDAQYRVRGADVSDFSVLLYDSGWLDVWPAIYPTESLDWEEDNWWEGKLLAEDRAGYTSALIHLLPAATRARYWRVEFDDLVPANPDGYVEAGRLFLAGQWQPAVNHSWGASLGYEDPTEIESSLGGQEYFDARTKFRVYRCTLRFLDHDEGHARALEAPRRLGISGEAFVVPDPNDTTHMIRRAFLCRLRQLSALEYPYFDNTTMGFELKEIV
ncbi:MAG: hypothetical protein HYU77_13900 [Betaproteobacteria bacterium]|nr:hypothetical protein [Betaproteobacteria bacterium]